MDESQGLDQGTQGTNSSCNKEVNNWVVLEIKCFPYAIKFWYYCTTASPHTAAEHIVYVAS
jgi:hypothetical protein